MSNFANVAGGIQAVLQTNVTGLKAYKYAPDAVNDPYACLILPEPLDPEQAFGGNTFHFTFRLVVLLVSADPVTGWTNLYEMIDPTQATVSVIKAIRADPTLNGQADTATITRIENIGRRSFGDPPVTFFGFDAILDGYKSVA